MGRLLDSLGIQRRYGRKFGVLLLVTTLLVASVGGVIYLTIDDELTEDTEQELQTRANDNANQVDNWFALTEQQFVEVTRSSAVRSGEVYRSSDQLTRISSRDEIAGTYLVNRSTEVVTVATGGMDVTDSDDRLRPALADRTERVVQRSGGRVSYSAPFRLAGNQPVLLAVTEAPSNEDRALLAVIDLEQLSRTLYGTDGDREATVSVLNESGTVVLSSDRDALLTEAAVEGSDGDSGAVTETDDDRAVGYAAVDTRGWIATNQLPTSEAYGLRETVSKQILLLLAVLVVSLGAIGLTIGRNTVRSVTDLADCATALREGDLETEIGSDREDEFGDVYDAFDEMRTSLKEQIDEAESARREAEVSRAEALELTEHLQEKATEYSRVMQRCAGGDLTQRMDGDEENEAMDRIASEFNEMIEELEKTVGQLETYVDEVEEGGAAVEESAAAVREASEQVADSIERISVDADEQTRRIEAVSATLSSLATRLAELAGQYDDEQLDKTLDDLRAATGEVESMVALTEQSQSEVSTVSAAAEEQAAELTEVSERANELQRYARPLRDILGRFETEAEHEFVFSTGPTGNATAATTEDER